MIKKKNGKNELVVKKKSTNMIPGLIYFSGKCELCTIKKGYILKILCLTFSQGTSVTRNQCNKRKRQLYQMKI